MSDNKLPNVPANPGKSWHEVVKRPNDLAKKVPKSGGVDPEKAFANAENIVKKMTSEYVDKLASDIQEMSRLGDIYEEDPSDANLDQLFRLVHNMRGQGATFGFPLITEIGRNFCRYVRERPPGKKIHHGLVEQHIKALQVVYAQSIKGTGDEISQAVVKALADVVEQELS